jgi:hypothetical protein
MEPHGAVIYQSIHPSIIHDTYEPVVDAFVGLKYRRRPQV